MTSPRRKEAGSSRGKPASSQHEPEATAEGGQPTSAKPATPLHSAAKETGRGRHARSPVQVPLKGWLDILSRTKQQLAEDNLSIVAAGVAFYGFVAVAPSLAALIALYALIADPARISEHISLLARVLPDDVVTLIEGQITRISSDNQKAGFGLAIGVLLALYSSSRATLALIAGLNIAYDEHEKRGFVKLNLVALGLTLFALVGALFSLGLVAVTPPLLAHLPISADTEALLGWLRWPVLFIGFMAALTVMYRYAPDRNEPQWKWVSFGAVAGTALWLLGSAAFSLYVSRFGSYDETYGSLGAIVVFLLWLYLSAFVVLIGAELNAEMERQTKADTTGGMPKPPGRREARAADTVGPAHH